MEDNMLYSTDTKKKECFIVILMINFLIFTGLADTGNALDSYKNAENDAHFDFGTQPLGISQTTREFYLCAKDSKESQEDKKPSITIVEKNKVKMKQTRPKNIHRWNIPDSRSRINMNRWLKKTKKNQVAIHIDPAYITGENSNAFKIKDNQCNQNKLLPGSTCHFEVSYSPKIEGQQRANIIIPYSHNNEKKYYMMLVTGSAKKCEQPKMALLP
jgi:hypothetical protein